jgi:filamentous hemagglutinin family protein
VVTAGDASIAAQGNAMTIEQGSDKAILEWGDFSIGSGASVDFRQPGSGSVALNRVVGGNPSAIHGSLSANGKLFLVNPSGILFGAGSSVNVGGLVASTLGISDSDFLSGNYRFSGSGGAVVNQGNINAAVVALLGSSVTNEGVIGAQAGSVALATGEQMTLTFADGLTVTVDGEELDALEEEGEAVQGEDGAVAVTESAARSLESRVVAESEPEADGIQLGEDGTLRLVASAPADPSTDPAVTPPRIVAGGTIEAEKILVDAGPRGEARVEGLLTASAESGPGGSVTITGNQVELAPTARLAASGGEGGGSIRVGGGFQGGDESVRNASTTIVNFGAQLEADATTAGDGGEVIVWADGYTGYGGAITARGGPQGGEGGFAEVSGKRVLDFRGTADLTAPAGSTGTLLLDPTDLEISNGSDNNVNTADGNHEFAPVFGDQTTVLNVATLATSLGTANTLVTTVGSPVSSGEAGDITVVDPVTWTSGNQLTLSAAGAIFVNASLDGSTGNADIDLRADDLTIDSAATIDAGAGRVTIQPTVASESGSSTINLGGTSGLLTLSDAELDRITADTLQIGSGTARPIVVLEAGLGPDNVASAFSLVSGGSIGQSTSGSVSYAGGFRIDAGGTVNFDQNANEVATLAAATSSDFLQFEDSDDLVIGSVDGTSGLSTASNTLQLVTGGTLTQTDSIVTQDLMILAGGAVALGHLGNDVATLAAAVTGAGNGFTYYDANSFRTGTIFVSGVTTDGGAIDLRADGDDSVLTVASGKPVTVGGNTALVSLRADELAIEEAVTGSYVTLKPVNGDAIDLGSSPGSANTLELTQDELARIDATTLQIGGSHTGAITVTSAIDATQVAPGGNTNLYLLAGDTISGSSTLTVGGNFKAKTIANSGAIDLTGLAVDGTIEVTTDGTGNATLTNDDGLAFASGIFGGGEAIGGNFTATATSGNITQSGALKVNGTASFTTAADDATITLDNTGNSFGGAVSLSTDDTNDDDNGHATVDGGSDALELGASTVGGDLTVTSGHASGITDSGTVTVDGNFSATTDANNGVIQLSSLAVDGTIAVATDGTGNASVTNDAGLTLASSTVGGDFSATATTGSLTQSGGEPLTVTGTSLFNTAADGQDLTLDDSGNDFGGAVTFRAGDGSDAGFGNLSFRDSGPVRLASSAATAGDLFFDASTDGAVGGTLAVTAGSGDLTQSQALAVTGASTFTVAANGANIDLSAANTFSHSVTLRAGSGGDQTFGDIVFNDLNAVRFVPSGSVSGNDHLFLDAATDGAVGGNLTVTARDAGSIIEDEGLSLLVTGTASFQATGNDITLGDGADTPNFGTLIFEGAAVSISEGSPMQVGTSTSGAGGSGSLSLSANGALTQTGAITANDGASFASGTAAITLNNGGNHFSGAVGFTTSGSGGSVQIFNGSNPLVLGASTVGGGFFVDTSGAAITQSGALDVEGAVDLGSGNAPITLADASNDFSGIVTVNLSDNGSGVQNLPYGASALTLADANDLTLGALATNGGAIDLSGVAGPVTLSSVATTLGGPFTASGIGSFDASGQVIDTTGGDDTAGGAVTVATTGSGALTVETVRADGGTDTDGSGGEAGGTVDLNAGGLLTLHRITTIGSTRSDDATAGAVGGAVSLTGGTGVQITDDAGDNDEIETRGGGSGASQASGGAITVDSTSGTLDFLEGRVRLSTGAQGGDITFNADADFVQFSHGLEAGTGNIVLQGVRQGVEGRLEVESAHDVTVNGTMDQGGYKQGSGTGETRFLGQLNLTREQTSGKGFEFTGNNLSLEHTGSPNTVVNRFLVTNSGTFTTAAGVDLEISGRLEQSGGGSSVLGGTITLTDSGVLSFADPVTLQADSVTLKTHGSSGDHLTLAAVDADDASAHDRTLTLDAGTGGTVTVSGALGSTQPLAGLTLVQSNGASFSDAVTVNDGSGTITLTDTADGQLIDFQGDVTAATLSTAAEGYNLALTGGATLTTDTTFQNNGTVQLGDASGDAMTFSGDLDFDSGVSAVTLGGSIEANTLELGNFGGTTTLAADATVNAQETGNQVTARFGPLAGNQTLTVGTNGLGNIDFGDATIGSLVVNEANYLSFYGDFETTGAIDADQNIGGKITMGSAASLTAGGVLDADAAQGLNLDGSIEGAAIHLGAGGHAITLNGDLAITSGSGGVSLGGPVDADDASAHDRTLTLDAGTGGTVTVSGALGSTQPLAGLTLVQSNGASFSGAVTVNDGSGTITLTDTADGQLIDFQGDVTAATLSTAAEGYNLALLADSGSLSGGETLTLSSATTFLNTGSLTLGDEATDQLDLNLPAPSTFEATAPSSVKIAGSLVTTGDAVILGDSNTPVTLGATTAIDTSNGGSTPGGAAITFGGTLDGTTAGGEDLTLDGGTGGLIAVEGAVGATTRLGAVSVDTGYYFDTGPGGVDVVFRAASYTQTGTGTAQFDGAVSLTGNLDFTGSRLRMMNGDHDIDGTMEVTNTGSFTLGNGGTLTVGGGFTQDGSGTSTIGGDLTLDGTGALSFSTDATLDGDASETITFITVGGSGDDITFNGQLLNAASESVVFDAGEGGAVLFTGGGTAGQIQLDSGTLTLENAASFEFIGNVEVEDLITKAQDYSVNLNGGSNTFAQAVEFLNTGTVTLGDHIDDTFAFDGGLTVSGNGGTSPAVQLHSTLRSAGGNAIDLGTSAVTLTGDSGIDTTDNGGTPSGGNLTLGGPVTDSGNTYDLTR